MENIALTSQIWDTWLNVEAERWIEFGQGQSVRWLPVQDMVRKLSPKKSPGMCFSMPSLVVMLSQPFVVEAKGLPGKSGKCVLKCLMSLISSVNTHQYQMMQISGYLTSLS